MRDGGPARTLWAAPRRVVVTAVALVVALLVVGLFAGDPLKPFTSDDPGSESVAAREELGRASGVDPYFDVVVLVRAGKDVTGPAGRAKVERVARILRRDPLIRGVRTFRDGGRQLVSLDRRSSYVVGGLAPAPIEEHLDASERIEDALSSEPGVKVGGRAAFYAHGNETAESDLVRSELLVLPLLLLIALWVFRGFVAALLPLVVGGLTVVGAVAGLRIASESSEVSIYAINIVTALGLGLAVDYSLLVLSRWREELRLGGFERAALERTMQTAGRTVAFSSLTVAGAGASLLVFPLPFLRSIGIGTILVALLAGGVALTVLPAVLVLLRHRVNALSPRRWRRAAERAAGTATDGGWYRLSRLVMRRPGLVAAAAAIVLLALGAPSLGMSLTQVDASVMPRESSDRQVSEAVEREFPPSRQAATFLAVDAPAGAAARRRLDSYAERLRERPDVSAVSAPERVGPHTWRIDVIPSSSPLSSASQGLVRAIRSTAGPYPVKAGGESASLVDLKAGIGDHLPLALAILFVVTALPLLFATKSLVLPVKAVLMNALTLAATFGVMVLVFQNGALEGVLGYTSSGALEASVVVIIFAVAFALATDYGVFLLSRIREIRDAGARNSEAVALGLERTGRVVTAAALLLCVALGSLVTARHALVKEVGVGTALAVAIDATIVRALLLPSLMQLLGRVNWWVPGFLRRPLRVDERRRRDPKPGAAYLAPTRYCDVDHPAIRAAVREVLDGHESDRVAAIKLFRFVRDNVRYEFGPWGVTASHTLEKGGGTCTNKSTLLVALLRAAGIPAAFGVLRVDAQHYFGPIGPQFLTRFASTSSVHVYAAVHIAGRWVRCDPSTDSELAGKTSHFCRQTRLVEWDGLRDSLDFLEPQHIHEDLGLFADIDHLLDKPARGATPEVLAMANAYLAFIRDHDTFPSSEALIEAYARRLEDGDGRPPRPEVAAGAGG